MNRTKPTLSRSPSNAFSLEVVTKESPMPGSSRSNSQNKEDLPRQPGSQEPLQSSLAVTITLQLKWCQTFPSMEDGKELTY